MVFSVWVRFGFQFDCALCGFCWVDIALLDISMVMFVVKRVCVGFGFWLWVMGCVILLFD